MISEYQIRLTSSRGETAGTVTVEEYSGKMRAIRTGFAWTGALLALIIAAIIPVAHIVLFPLTLIAAPIVAYLVSAKKQIILEGRGTCPHCNASFIILSRTFKFPFSDICTECNRTAAITLAP